MPTSTPVSSERQLDLLLDTQACMPTATVPPSPGCAGTHTSKPAEVAREVVAYTALSVQFDAEFSFGLVTRDI